MTSVPLTGPVDEPLYTPDVARRTAGVLERVRRVIPEMEWPVHAPYVDAIREWKERRNAVVLAHNYQTPEIFHGVADIVGDSLALAQKARGDRRRRHRARRRPLHGRDGEDPEPGEDGAHPGRRGGLLARVLDHRRRRAPAAAAVPGRAGRDLRQHLGRGEGGVGRLLHVGERRRGRRVAEGPARRLPARRVPRPIRGVEDEDRDRAVEGPLRGPRALHRGRDRPLPPAAPRRLGPRPPGVPARRPRRRRLRRLDGRDDRPPRRRPARGASCSSPSAR